MSDPTNLTSPNPVIDTRPDRKGALLPSVQDYYERYRNPNLFISNNANPFLISPYAPNQISQTTKNSILATDVIKPFTPNKTIEVQGSMMAEAPNYFLTGPNQPLLHDSIYSPNYTTPAVVAACSTAFTPEFVVAFSGNPRLSIDNTGALFTDGAGTFALNVEGSVAIDASLVPNTNTLDLTTTPLSAAAPVTLQGYLPVLMNGAQRYVPFYSSP
jgi:hypothetical protein